MTAWMGSADPLRYDVAIDLSDENSAHSKVIRAVGADKKVLELGCSTGRTSELLTEARCRVTGIEIDPEAAALASRFCERVIIADLGGDFGEEFRNETFDVVVAADVLEHVVDPWALLERLPPLLGSGGRVVASIPNVAHASVRLALLEGRFPYAKFGLLDRTHLRFFTADSTRELFDRTGYRILDMQHVTRAFDDSVVEVDLDQVPSDVVDRLRDDPYAEVYQFVVIAEPAQPTPLLGTPSAGSIGAADPIIQAQAAELGRLSAEIDRLNAELSALRSSIGRHRHGWISRAIAKIR